MDSAQTFLLKVEQRTSNRRVAQATPHGCPMGGVVYTGWDAEVDSWMSQDQMKLILSEFMTD